MAIRFILCRNWFAKAALSITLLVSIQACKKEYITEQTIVAPPPADENAILTKFWLSPDVNADYIHDSIVFDINGSLITGRIPYYSSVKALVPSFETNGEKVMVNGVAQTSGSSSQDFGTTVQYTVAGKNGAESQYSVNLINFTGLPVLKINTVGDAPVTTKDTYVNGTLKFDGAGLFADAETPLQIRGRGNSTWGMPKKPYKLKLGTKQSFFNAPESKDWVLLANYTDKSQLRNDLALFMGSISELEWTPRSHFVELFLNEVYQGTYQLCEGIEVGEDRVNITDEGFLLEVDQENRMEPDDVYFKTGIFLLNIKEPEVSKDDAKYNFIKNHVITIQSTLYGANFKDPENGYAKYLDVASFVDWFLINEISKNNDAAFVTSCYMNMAPGGKLKMGPLWDFDIAFGNINYNGNNSPQGFWVQGAPWIARLFQDPAFVEKVKTRFAYFKSKKQEIFNEINKNATSLKWSALENNNRWRTLYAQTWPNYAIWGSYDNEVMYLKNWLNARMDWLEGALNGL